MTTVAEFGSVKYRVDRWRRLAHDERLLHIAAFGAIEGAVDDDWLPNERKVELARNAIAAVNLLTQVPDRISLSRPEFVDGPCEDPDCPNASWIHPASADLAESDPTGLAYTRADDGADDPPPVSGGRIQPHTGGVVDGGDLVDETPVTIEDHIAAGGTVENIEGRLVFSGGLAEPVIHVSIMGSETQCGLAVHNLPPGHTTVPTWSHVSTCMACSDKAPF